MAEWFIETNLAIGLEANYSHFYEEVGSQTWEFGNTTLTGDSYKYFDAFPILLTGRYYMNLDVPDQKLVPYAGFGLGTFYVKELLKIGSLSIQDDGWVFGLKPTVGVMTPVEDRLWLYTEASYYKTFEASDLEAYTYFTLVVGLRIGF